MFIQNTFFSKHFFYVLSLDIEFSTQLSLGMIILDT